MDYSNLFVCLMGLCTVFVGLICIIVLVSVMSNVVRRTDAKTAAPAIPAPAAAPAVSAVTPEMVAAVAAAIRRNRVGISPKHKPVSFIFVGSTGGGKTELVKQLADDLFNAPESLIRLDMSEFMEKHSVSRIVGSPPGYVGYEEGGQMTDKVSRKPN